MKKILLALLIMFFIGCDGADNSYPVLPQGEVKKVIKDGDNTIIYVRFIGAGNHSNTFKFIGSDTCKVGQTITIQ